MFSSKSLNSNSDIGLNPVAILELTELSIKDNIKSYRETLHNKSGIYSFFNTVNNKQYIGSAKDLFIRLNEHLNNKKSNVNL